MSQNYGFGRPNGLEELRVILARQDAGPRNLPYPYLRHTLLVWLQMATENFMILAFPLIMPKLVCLMLCGWPCQL